MKRAAAASTASDAASAAEQAAAEIARVKRARKPVARFEDPDEEGDPSLRVALERSRRVRTMEEVVIEEAPVFYPTDAEWADPCAYLAAVTVRAEAAGICKIVPPAGWDLPCTIAAREASDAKYVTRLQQVHALQEGLPFPDGETHTFTEYRAQAEAFKQRHYPHLVHASRRGRTSPSAGSDNSDAERGAARCQTAGSDAAPSHEGVNTPALSAPRGVSPLARMMPLVEREYWRIVERGTPEVEVEYGNDQDTRTVGSGFPMPRRTVADVASGEAHAAAVMAPRWTDPDYYRDCGWNLHNLPFMPGSVLRHLNEEINGVNVPWLYLGMLFSSFAWHNEDHYMYSMNYMHFGEGKTWYGVPGVYAPEFERAMTNILYGRAKDDKDIFYQLTTVVPPAQLIGEKVPVYHLFQEPGEFVVTFPQAYHAGFSHGFNMAEACNFSLPDWLPLGRKAVERYRSPNSQRTVCFSHEQLVYNLARCCSQYGMNACGNILEELRHLLAVERKERTAMEADGLTMVIALPNKADPRYECVRCRHICHLSAVVCRCPSANRQVACLRHARQLCPCPSSAKLLVSWYDIAELERLLAHVTERMTMLRSVEARTAAGGCA